MTQKVELALSVSTYDGHPPKRALGARVTDDTCVIGRDASCQLTLPDPEREVSGQHVLIYRQGDGFAVLDVSRNGTFLNGAEEPLDPSQPVELHHGDRLTIGRYVVEVGFVRPADALAQTAEARQASRPPDERPDPSSVPDILSYLDADSTMPAIDAPSQRRTPPPDSGAERSTAASPDVVSAPVPSVSDRGDAEGGTQSQAQRETAQAHEAMPPPSVESSAPDPADAPTTLIALAEGPARGSPETMGGQRVASPPPPAPGSDACPGVEDGPSAEAEPMAAEAEAPASDAPDPGRALDPGRTMEGPGQAAKLGRAPVLDDATRIRSPAEESPPRPLSPAESRQIEAFLAGLGAGHPDEVGDAPRLMGTSGRLLRALTQGLVTLTMAQSRFDTELRGGISPAPPASVNPFRFCVDLEDMLARMLWRPGRGDIDPSLAARQAFEDLEVHQAALTAGLHAVVKALLARLEPHAIEQETEGRVGLSQLRPNARKAACWESYTKSFEEVADDLADDFPQLMGDVFGRAYDDQVERLRAAKQRR